MKGPGTVVIFCHSLVSDWNHGNAHFLRGLASELLARGHAVRVYEPEDGWSRRNLVAEHGTAPLDAFAAAFPQLRSTTYDPATLDLDAALDGARIVLVHEWNDPALVARLGAHRARARSYRLFFHDTHHRALTDPRALAAYDLRDYDGVLAFGEVLRAVYVRRGWARAAWTWHEAADVRVFRPHMPDPFCATGDVVFVGNGGDDERTAELLDYLVRPVAQLRVGATVHGVRYPPALRDRMLAEGFDVRGWLPNAAVPDLFARHRVTVHVPRRPYARTLHGVPTIRVFEALACGIPLVCAPWEDSEGLFSPGVDYLVAHGGDEMRRLLRLVLGDPATARELARRGLATIRARHTCAHRVDELLAIAASCEAGSGLAGQRWAS